MVLQQFTFKRIEHNSLSKRFVTTATKNGFAIWWSCFPYSSLLCTFVKISPSSVVKEQVHAIHYFSFCKRIVKINEPMCSCRVHFVNRKPFVKKNQKKPSFMNMVELFWRHSKKLAELSLTTFFIFEYFYDWNDSSKFMKFKKVNLFQ